MAVYRKDQIAKHIEQLGMYSQDLRSVLVGTTPDANACHEYNCESDQFEREFVETNSSLWEISPFLIQNR